MADTRLNDIVRQFAVVLTAISQVYFSYTIGREILPGTGQSLQVTQALVIRGKGQHKRA